VSVERLENTPEGRHDGQSLPPPDAKFRDDSMRMNYFPVNLIEEKQPGQILRRQEQAKVCQNFIIGQGRRVKK
jgi:hypothetical protein